MPIAFGKQFPDEFQNLIDCLADQQWEEANRITERLESSRTRLILDELWTKFSNGRFGFSIQSQIWQEVGGFIYSDNVKYNYKAGWESGDSDSFMEARDRYLNRIGCGKFDFSFNAPPGHLPFGNGGSLDAFIDRFSDVVATRDP
jgi:GUN4-like